MNRVRSWQYPLTCPLLPLATAECPWPHLAAGAAGKHTLAGTQVREEMMVFGECLASSDNHIKISIV